MQIRDPRWKQFGSGIEKKSDPGSAINIPDPQHCCWLVAKVPHFYYFVSYRTRGRSASLSSDRRRRPSSSSPKYNSKVIMPDIEDDGARKIVFFVYIYFTFPEVEILKKFQSCCAKRNWEKIRRHRFTKVVRARILGQVMGNKIDGRIVLENYQGCQSRYFMTGYGE